MWRTAGGAAVVPHWGQLPEPSEETWRLEPGPSEGPGPCLCQSLVRSVLSWCKGLIYKVSLSWLHQREQSHKAGHQSALSSSYSKHPQVLVWISWCSGSDVISSISDAAHSLLNWTNWLYPLSGSLHETEYFGLFTCYKLCLFHRNVLRCLEKL